jgi:GT2 family glycosyltransferase
MKTTVVIATRNRHGELLRTLGKLHDLRPQPPIIVVDNGSHDGTTTVVRREFPAVDVIELDHNEGSAARNIGVSRATTPYVAFSDDDSWWAPDALTRAERLLDDNPRVGLIAATTLVGPGDYPDPVVTLMSTSPLGHRPGLPGPSILGFLACSAVVRREAHLASGGFSSLLHFAAEEKLLSYDLATAGWELCYVDQVLAHHHPSVQRPSGTHRRAQELRNNLLIAWLRRPLTVAVGKTVNTARQALRDPTARLALTGSLRRLPAALTSRARLPARIEYQVRLLEGGHDHQ